VNVVTQAANPFPTPMSPPTARCPTRRP
jgi:hypothetical protein